MIRKGPLRKGDAPYLFFLILILCLAAAIRIRGAWFGFPLPVHPDEPRLVETALRMISTGDLNPHFFNYPTLNIYIQASLYQLANFIGHAFDVTLSEKPVIWYHLIGRIFNALLSVGTIVVTFLIGKRLLSPLAGLSAAVFLTFSFLHVSNSYLVTVDASVAFWSALTTLMAVAIFQGRANLVHYILAGVLVGLAVSSKYTAFVCAAPLLVAHLYQSRDTKVLIDRKIVLGLVSIPIAFLLTTPYALLDYGSFWSAITYESEHYTRGHPGHESVSDHSYELYARYLFSTGYGVLPTILAGLGLAWLVRQSAWKAAMIVLFPLLLFVLVGKYRVYFPRNIVAITPFLSLLSGFFVSAAYGAWVKSLPSLRRGYASLIGPTALTLLLVASVWQQAVLSIDRVMKITLPDTRWVSLEWIVRSLPPGSRIGREHYTPPIEDWSDKFETKDLGYFAVAKRHRAIPALDYMVVSSSDYGRFTKNPLKYPVEAKRYADFFERNRLVKEFVPDFETMAGPKISVYEIGPGTIRPDPEDPAI